MSSDKRDAETASIPMSCSAAAVPASAERGDYADERPRFEYDEWDKTDPNLCPKCGGDVASDGFCWECDF